MKLVLSFIALVSLAAPGRLVATPADDKFQKVAGDYIQSLLETNPEYATELGDHRFDDRLTDYSEAVVAKELRGAKQIRQELEQFNDLSQLTGANKVDV